LIPGVERNRQDGDLLVVTHSDREAHMFAARAAGFDAHLIDIAEVPDCWPVASRAAWQFAVLT
jgi:hypothetical protein